MKIKHIVTNYPYLSWDEIASHFIDRSALQCSYRWLKVLQPGLKKGKWSLEEDNILKNWVSKNGACKWSKLSLMLHGRSSKQIRDRWINNLNPQRENFKWTKELEKELLIGYLKCGTSWVSIAKLMPNSSENMIKNRFYSMLRSLASKHFRSSGQKLKMKKIVENTKSNELDLFFNFDSDISSTAQDQIKTKYKRNNHTLTYLLEFLPTLLEERGIDISLYCTKEVSKELSKKENGDLQQEILNEKVAAPKLQETPSSSKLSTEQEAILNNFFNTLSQKISSKDEEVNLKDRNTQFKIKSSILFNLQLRILHKIFERFRCQLIQRFFEDFRSKTNRYIN